MSQTLTRVTLRRLSVMAYCHGFTLWHYRSDADGREALDAEWWRDARDLIHPGDIVYATGPAGAVQLQFAPDLAPRQMSATP